MSGRSSIVIDSEIGVTKAELRNKEAVGSFTAGEIDVTTKADLGNKEVVGTSKPLVGIEKPKEERKAVPGVTTERVPESYIARIKARPLRKIPPLSDDDDLFTENPSIRATIDAGIAHNNYLVDMEQDCLRQHAAKGHAEVGVDFSSGVKRMFILSN